MAYSRSAVWRHCCICLIGTSPGPESRFISVYHRFLHTAHDSYMAKVSAYFQSEMYIRSRMSSRLVLSVVCVPVCQRLTSSLTSLKGHGQFVVFDIYCNIMLISTSYNYCSVPTANKCFSET